MAAIVAAALGQLGDKTAWLVAILADRYRAPGRVIAAAAVALLAASGIAAAGGAFIAPRITPEAKQLFLGMALVLQGGGAFFPVKMPERLSGWRLGAVPTTLVGLFILAFGDGVQFIVVTLAARTPFPVLAAIGATIGSLAVVVPAAILGEAAWARVPWRWVRVGAGALFLPAGAAIGLTAVGLL
ncbi:TMEM165/GDT1 family protein [uncultured Sphingomonas sp.]|uniref:TMEM165/GDT1 family protein n=1 Tax=uncultured Sphingomonas sp. TaxID=158754 RepID=UPI0035CAFC94